MYTLPELLCTAACDASLMYCLFAMFPLCIAACESCVMYCLPAVFLMLSLEDLCAHLAGCFL